MTEPLRAPAAKNYSDPADYFGKSESPGGSPPGNEASNRRSDPGAEIKASPGTQCLLDKHAPRLKLPPLSAAPKPTDTNSQRVGAKPVEAFHADAGKTSSGDAVYASLALLKGTAGDGEAEILSVSGQVGDQTEGSAVLGHVQVSVNPQTTVSVDAFTLKANAGIHNQDGSKGGNLGDQATFVQVEGAHQFVDGEMGVMKSGDSLNLGLSLGHGTAVHAGTRDSDGDGKVEYCVRLETGPFIVGACYEERPE